jgi:lipopolysaccharide biosynthesis regulator YciM
VERRTIMDWIQILAIVVPIVAFLGWMYNRIERFEKMDSSLKEEFKSINATLSQLKDRVLIIEVQMRSGPYHWEPKIVEKKEE